MGRQIVSCDASGGKYVLDTAVFKGTDVIAENTYFLHYRGLGLVSVSSLLVASLLAYLAVVLPSNYQDFTMELSGIAGLIVAIGITADSFIVFFERLRGEVRDGKSLRAAVEGG